MRVVGLLFAALFFGLSASAEDPPAASKPGSEVQQADTKSAPRDLIGLIFKGAFKPEELERFGAQASPEELCSQMSPDQRSAARSGLRAAEVDAKSPDELIEIARGYAMLDNAGGSGADALRAASRVLEVRPDDGEALDLQAIAYARLGDAPKAIQAARKAQKLQSDDETARVIILLSGRHVPGEIKLPKPGKSLAWDGRRGTDAHLPQKLPVKAPLGGLVPSLWYVSPESKGAGNKLPPIAPFGMGLGAGIAVFGVVRSKDEEECREIEKKRPGIDWKRELGALSVAVAVGFGVVYGGRRLGAALLALGARSPQAVEEVAEAGTAEAVASDHAVFDVAPRVLGQLDDPRLGPLTGKIGPADLQRLANNPSAIRLFDARSGNINVIQKVDGILLRITVVRDSFKIISVGRIQPNQISNRIASGDFIPLR